jgi:hypothetical protein
MFSRGSADKERQSGLATRQDLPGQADPQERQMGRAASAHLNGCKEEGVHAG